MTLTSLILDTRHQILRPGFRAESYAELERKAGVPPVGVAPPRFAFLVKESPAFEGARWLPLAEALRDDECWKDHTTLLLGGYEPPSRELDAYSFGNDPFMAARLAHLVVKGKKRATSGRVEVLEKLQLTVPKPGTVSIVTDGYGIPICCTRTLRVDHKRFRDVTEDVAIGEGEGDLTLADWRRGHAEYFSKEAARLSIPFDDQSEILTEWFEVLKVFSPVV